jgi:hypothetical protein
VALVTDLVFADDAALRYSTLVVALPALTLGGVLLLLARRRHLILRGELEAGAQADASNTTSSGSLAEVVAMSER